jgi:hypothetical protein
MLKKILCLIAITFVWSAFDVLAMDTISDASKSLNNDKNTPKSITNEELNNKQLELILKSKNLKAGSKSKQTQPEQTV